VAASLEGGANCEIVLRPERVKAGNPRNLVQRMETHYRKLEIGRYIDLSAKGGKPKDADWRAAEIQYGISKTTARNAHKYWEANDLHRLVEKTKKLKPNSGIE
jgi:hypothetical protein